MIIDSMKSLFLSSKSIIMTVSIISLILSSCASSTISSNKIQPVIANITNEQPKEKVAPKVKSVKISQNHPTHTGEVILLRGFGNIFSKGIDVIGKRLKAEGVNTRVHNHSTWKKIAADIVKRAKQGKISYPIIIIGHSLGANASVQMASYLGRQGISVSLVITFDPTIVTFVGHNVKEIVNYYIPNGKNKVREEGGFRGKISNIDVSNISNITHLNIEKSMKLQNQSIQAVIKLIKK